MSWWRPKRSLASIDEEVEAHLEALAAEHLARGLSPEEARAAARRDFGSVASMKDAWLDQRGMSWLDSVGQDVRHASMTSA